MYMLSGGDKDFLKLYGDGVKPSAAFRQAYPEHEASQNYINSQSGTPERQKSSEVLRDAAKSKLKSQYIKNALMTYQDSMERFSALSLDTATDLVVNARSEKVRADLAIEGIRHKVGTPVQKVQVQEQKTVYLTFGAPPTELPINDIIEGEVIEGDDF